MAQSFSLRRSTASILAIVVLAALAIVARVGPSVSASASSGTVERPGVSTQPAQLVSHHVLSTRTALAVRSAGPLSVKPFAARTTRAQPSREYSPASVTPPDYSITSGYDATAPPRMLLS